MPTINGYNVTSGANLTGADLSNANLSNIDLSGCNFTNADFTNSNLSNATLDHANLTGVTLTNTTLTGIDFTKVSAAKDIIPSNGLGVTFPGNYYISKGYLLNTDRTVEPLQSPADKAFLSVTGANPVDLSTNLSNWRNRNNAVYGDYFIVYNNVYWQNIEPDNIYIYKIDHDNNTLTLKQTITDTFDITLGSGHTGTYDLTHHLTFISNSEFVFRVRQGSKISFIKYTRSGETWSRDTRFFGQYGLTSHPGYYITFNNSFLGYSNVHNPAFDLSDNLFVARENSNKNIKCWKRVEASGGNNEYWANASPSTIGSNVSSLIMSYDGNYLAYQQMDSGNQSYKIQFLKRKSTNDGWETYSSGYNFFGSTTRAVYSMARGEDNEFFQLYQESSKFYVDVYENNGSAYSKTTTIELSINGIYSRLNYGNDGGIKYLIVISKVVGGTYHDLYNRINIIKKSGSTWAYLKSYDLNLGVDSENRKRQICDGTYSLKVLKKYLIFTDEPVTNQNDYLSEHKFLVLTGNVSYHPAVINNTVIAPDATITDIDFEGENITNVNMEGCELYGCDFKDINLSTVNIKNADFSGCVFDNTTFGNATGAEFNNQDLSGGVFTNATLTSVKSSSLTPANGFGLSLPTNYFVSQGVLRGPDVSTTGHPSFIDITGSNFDSNNLSNYNFLNTDLSGVSFAGSTLTGTNFSNAQNMRYATSSSLTQTTGIKLPETISIVGSAFSFSPAAPTGGANTTEAEVNTFIEDAIGSVSAIASMDIETLRTKRITNIRKLITKGVTKKFKANKIFKADEMTKRGISATTEIKIAKADNTSIAEAKSNAVSMKKGESGGDSQVIYAPLDNVGEFVTFQVNSTESVTFEKYQKTPKNLYRVYKNSETTASVTDLSDNDVYEFITLDGAASKFVLGSVTGLATVDPEGVKFFSIKSHKINPYNVCVVLEGMVVSSTLAVLPDITGNIRDMSVNAVATYDVSLSAINNVFRYTTDGTDVEDATSTDISYSATPANWDPSNNIKYSLGTVIQSAVGPFNNNTNIKKDNVRHMAQEIFGSYVAVDIFQNENDLRDDVSTVDLSFNEQIRTLLNIGVTDNSDTSKTNFPREIFLQLIQLKADRIRTQLTNERNITHAVTFDPSGYKIDGVLKPTLTLKRGFIYTFDISDSANSHASHPFKLYADQSRTDISQSVVDISGASGQAGAFTKITVDNSTLDTLYYDCSSAHTDEGGQLNIVDGDLDYGSLPIPFQVGDKIAIKLTYQYPASNLNLVKTKPDDRSYGFLITLVAD